MTIKFDVLNRFTGAVQFTAELETKSENHYFRLGLAVKWAITHGANLRSADLSGANLNGADLRSADLNGADLNGADLSGANLNGADLSGANLRSADLSGANLRSADLSGANLRSANLRSADLRSAGLRSAGLRSANLNGANLNGADLRSADLRSADLSGANLNGANLNGANLNGANLRSADLSGANLRSADLSGAKNSALVIASTRILPEGALIGWKKCNADVIVKLRIPENAKRSHAFGRECRAEFAEVLEVFGAAVGVSQHDNKTEYRQGETVKCDKWCADYTEECAGGIHFYITRIEVENH